MGDAFVSVDEVGTVAGVHRLAGPGPVEASSPRAEAAPAAGRPEVFSSDVGVVLRSSAWGTLVSLGPEAGLPSMAASEVGRELVEGDASLLTGSTPDAVDGIGGREDGDDEEAMEESAEA